MTPIGPGCDFADRRPAAPEEAMIEVNPADATRTARGE